VSQTGPQQSFGLLDHLSSLFRTYAIPAESLVVPAPFDNDDRACFTIMVPEEWTSDANGTSTVQLLEDGQHLGPAGANHDDIRTLGRGRFSHWNNKVWFSTSDSSDPNTNGRTYSIVPPEGWAPKDGKNFWTERKSMRRRGEKLDVEWTLHDLPATAMDQADGKAFAFNLRGEWPSDEGSFSTLLVLEDGQPLPQPHAEPADVVSSGAGRYAHRGQRVLFSASDSSDPRSNGKTYSYAHADAFLIAHCTKAPVSNGGFAWLVDSLPSEWPSEAEDGCASRVRVLEDGVLLGPHAASHDSIRDEGMGAYSHWGPSLWFSTSDNSDPNTNGRTYTVLQLEEDD